MPETNPMKIDLRFVNPQGTGVEFQKDGTKPKVLEDGFEVARLVDDREALEKSGDSYDSTSLSKRIDIGASDKWHFDYSETVEDDEGSRESVPNEIGELGFVLKGNAAIQDSNVDVYQGLNPNFYTWRRPGDQVLFGNSMRCDSDGDGAICKGGEDLLDLNKEFSITTWMLPETVRGYFFGIAPFPGNDRLAMWIENNSNPGQGPLGTGINFRAYSADARIVGNFDDNNIGKPNCVTLVNYKDENGDFKFKAFVNGLKSTANLDEVRGIQPDVKAPLSVGCRLDEEGNPAYSVVGNVGDTIIHQRPLSDEECEAMYWNPNMGLMTAGVGSSSLKGVTGITDRDNATFYKLDDEYRGQRNIAWNFGTSGKTFYHGAPDNYPVPSFVAEAKPVRSGTPSTVDDNYVGNGDGSSHITLANPELHKLDSFLTMKVQAGSVSAGMVLYSESMDDATPYKYSLEVDDTDITLLKFIFENDIQSLSYTHPVPVFDGEPHTIKVYRDQTPDQINYNISIDGNISRFIMSESSEQFEMDNSTIGALDSNGVISNQFNGYIWDYTIGSVNIPINEGTGTNIKDSDGNSVGTLVDGGSFWGNFFVSRSRPSSETDKNITQVVERMMADFVIWWYPSNYTGTSKVYTPYTEGSDHAVEYVTVWNDVKKYCEDRGCTVIAITPFPTDGLANNGVIRGDLHKEASQKMLSSDARLVDGFSLAIEGSNTEFAPEYYFDGIHTNDAGQLEIFRQLNLFCQYIYDSKKSRHVVTEKVLADNIFLKGVNLSDKLEKKADSSEFITGSYAPEFSNLSNIDTIEASIGGELSYVRFGKTVNVFGSISVNATGSGSWKFTISLPFGTRFFEEDSFDYTGERCAGSVNCGDGDSGPVLLSATESKTEPLISNPNNNSSFPDNAWISFWYTIYEK